MVIRTRFSLAVIDELDDRFEFIRIMAVIR